MLVMDMFEKDQDETPATFHANQPVTIALSTSTPVLVLGSPAWSPCALNYRLQRRELAIAIRSNTYASFEETKPDENIFQP